MKSISRPDSTIEGHIEAGLELAAKNRWKREHWLMIWNERNHTPPDPKTRVEGSRYWQDLHDWTVEFACKNRFTAVATLRRWRYTNQMDNVPVPPSVWRSIRRDLASQRRSRHGCPGLTSLPDRLWELFMLDWN